jgi:hypothetical protein
MNIKLPKPQGCRGTNAELFSQGFQHGFSVFVPLQPLLCQEAAENQLTSHPPP